MRVLITGGASGLGAALVSACATRGDLLCVIDRAGPPEGYAGAWLTTDLAETGFSARIAEDLAAAGPFDLVVAAAGISAAGAFEDIPPDVQRRVIAVNLAAPVELVAHLMRTGGLARGGRLVLVASLSHYTGYPGAAVYAGTKDGLITLARSLRGPLWRQCRVRVHALAPGPIDTPHAARYAPDDATGKGRMPAADLARRVLALRGGSVVRVPGAGPRVLAALARLAPGLAMRMMRRRLYDPLASGPPRLP